MKSGTDLFADEIQIVGKWICPLLVQWFADDPELTGARRPRKP